METKARSSLLFRVKSLLPSTACGLTLTFQEPAIVLNAGHTCGLLPSRNLNSSMQGEDVINLGIHSTFAFRTMLLKQRVESHNRHYIYPPHGTTPTGTGVRTVFGFDSTGRSSVRVRVPLVLQSVGPLVGQYTV